MLQVLMKDRRKGWKIKEEERRVGGEEKRRDGGAARQDLKR